jgi:EC042_2821-lke REase
MRLRLSGPALLIAFAWQDAYSKASAFFPTHIGSVALRHNLDLLGTYRDNAVHFYNERDFPVVVHQLAQTSVKNFRDLLEHAFKQRLEDEINWRLLPIGIEPPVDVVTYMKGGGTISQNSAVKHFLAELAKATADVESVGEDRGRLMTIFNVKLEFTKKIGDADVKVGVGAVDADGGPLVVVKTQDPNKSHPLRQKDIIEKIDALHGLPFTSRVFQAIAWKHGLKAKSQYCWQAEEGVLTKYSNDTITFVTGLSLADVDAALTDYRAYIKSKSKKRSAA